MRKTFSPLKKNIIIGILFLTLVTQACGEGLMLDSQNSPSTGSSIDFFPEEFTTEIDNFRFYVTNVYYSDSLSLTETYQASEGFMLVHVNLIVENLGERPENMGNWKYTIKGSTSSGEYSYPSNQHIYSNYFGVIPPSFRIQIWLVFEVAKNISDLHLIIEATDWKNIQLREISIREVGIDLDLPYDPNRVDIFTEEDEGFSWIQSTTCRILDIERVGSDLQIMIEIDNPTGYALGPSEVFRDFEAFVIDKFGVVYATINYNPYRDADFSVPPGSTGTAKFIMEFNLPDDLERAALFFRSSAQDEDRLEDRWILYDLSEVQTLWKVLQIINTGHAVGDISWSPDAKVIASAGGNNVLAQVWDANNGELKSELQSSEGAWSAAWSPNGSLIALGLYGVIYFYDANSYNLLKIIEEENPWIRTNHLAWSPDDALIATNALDEYFIHIWDYNSGSLITSLDNNGGARNVAWSPDGRLLAVSNLDYHEPIRVWDTSTWEIAKEVYVMIEKYTISESVAWAPDSKQLAAVACFNYHDESFMIFDIESNEEVIIEMPSCVSSIDWSPDGTRLAVGGWEVYIYDVSRGQMLYTLTGTEWVSDVSWSPDGSKLAAAGRQNIWIWSISP